MSIIRVTVRTFQSVEHANMFVVMSEKVANESNSTDLKINVKVIQNVDQKNQVTLIDMEIFSDTGSVVVTWRVKESKDRFFVIDLIVADISLVVTKRSEFNSMLKKVDNDLSKFNEVLFDQNQISYQKITE